MFCCVGALWKFMNMVELSGVMRLRLMPPGGPTGFGGLFAGRFAGVCVCDPACGEDIC